MKLHTLAEITFSIEKNFQVNKSRLHFTSLFLLFTSLRVDLSEPLKMQSTSSRLESIVRNAIDFKSTRVNR